VTDWVAISSLATAGGTLALAGTTYASVRSANRAARVAEVSMLAQLRPLLLPSSPDDPAQRVGFFDNVGLTVPGGCAGVEVVGGNVYIALSLRNVGTGIAVLHGARFYPERRSQTDSHAPVEEYRRLTRDLYIAPGKMGFWQGAWRAPGDDPERAVVVESARRGDFRIDVLYGDYEGGQRVITAFGVIREDDGSWQVAAGRHWQIDRVDPR
jgi:hypothetical protein